MKITSFNPLIVTQKNEELIALFEELGFERRRQQNNIADQDITDIVMRHPDGFRVNIIETQDLPRETLTGIRMNVDNFDEAYQLLTSRGFTAAPGTEIIDTGSAKALLMISPSKTLIELIQHIHK